MSGYWYLGSPYSKHPRGLTAAHWEACREAGLLIAAGIAVYSPIAHTHPIAMLSHMDPLDHNIWLPMDQPLMEAAKGLIVLKLDGWSRSAGLIEEVKYFASINRPIVYMEPGIIPEELLHERA